MIHLKERQNIQKIIKILEKIRQKMAHFCLFFFFFFVFLRSLLGAEHPTGEPISMWAATYVGRTIRTHASI